MKKLISVLCLVCLVPFALCSCFEKEIEKLALSETSVELTVGDTAEISVSAEPPEAELKKISWKSSDKNIAVVEDGKIKAKSPGTATVTAETENGIKADCGVTVKDKEVTAVILSDRSTSVKKGGKIQLSARIQPADASDEGMEWLSADESIASVNSEGYVTGKKVGITQIICKMPNGKQATCIVTVKSGKPISPTLPSTAVEEESTSPTVKSSESSEKTENNGDIFPESSQRKLAESEVYGISPEKAQAAINEIFARHGYIFKDSKLRSFYESKPWYAPNSNFSESQFNEAERYNIYLFTKYR